MLFTSDTDMSFHVNFIDFLYSSYYQKVPTSAYIDASTNTEMLYSVLEKCQSVE